MMSRSQALTQIMPDVGRETFVGRWITITQEMVNAFADVTRDPQWIHTDVERARRESPFGGTVAHGYLTLSLLPHMLDAVGERAPSYDGLVMTVNYGLNRVRFPHPVPAGGRIRARSALLSVEEVKDNGLQLVAQVTVELDGASKPACVAEAVSRYYFSS